MIAGERPTVLLTGPVMESVVERQLAARFTLVPLTGLDGIDPRSVRAIATRVGSRPVDAALLERLPNLEIIGNFGVGYDSVDAAAAARRGIIVTNTPDVLNEDVADLAVGLLLAAVRCIPQADRFVRSGQWRERAFPLTATLRGRTVGLLGLGRIGRAIARRLDAFGLTLVYHSRHPVPDVSYRHFPDLKDMAAAVDTLVVVVPGGATTRHMVDAGVLAALGPQGVLVNVARGSVVDEAALLAALQSGTILAAGLDVFENEPNVPEAFFNLDNAVLLPHVASATVHTRTAMGQLVVDNLFAWFDGKGPLTPVPETPRPRR